MWEFGGKCPLTTKLGISKILAVLDPERQGQWEWRQLLLERKGHSLAKACGEYIPSTGWGCPSFSLPGTGRNSFINYGDPGLSELHCPSSAGKPHLFPIHSFSFFFFSFFLNTMENKLGKLEHSGRRGSFSIGQPGLTWLKNWQASVNQSPTLVLKAFYNITVRCLNRKKKNLIPFSSYIFSNMRCLIQKNSQRLEKA